MAIPLSVLDLSPVPSGATSAQALRNTLDLARLAERLGYHRYWLAEHHNAPGVACSAPEILIGHVADATERIRVGSGGMMLPNHTPLKVAEIFRVLEALHPGRIDLGIGRAPGTDEATALALRRSREALGAEDFPKQLAELLTFANGEFPAGHPFHGVTAEPADVALPPIWLLGSSTYSAQVAAVLGLSFAFAHHINPEPATAALRLYRERFSPSAELPRPRTILAVSAVCAETDTRAEELASSVDLTILHKGSERPGPLPSPEEARAYRYTEAERTQIRHYHAQHLRGAPPTLYARLCALVKDTGADELMITTMVHDHAARRRSYELLAGAFSLPGAPRTPLVMK
jgi:luciferase family oxidoreductase group 1